MHYAKSVSVPLRGLGSWQVELEVDETLANWRSFSPLAGIRFVASKYIGPSLKDSE